MSRDPRIDDYIEKQADFARPILERIREAMHAAGPEIQEGIKWSMPAFSYKGKPLAGMAAFKAHATLGFWDRTEVRGDSAQTGAMGDFGCLTSVADLPGNDELAEMIRKAASLIDAGAKPMRNKSEKSPIEMPGDLAAALAASPSAQAAYVGFPPSAQREYLEWVVEAKRPETRAKRIAQAVEWMAEGKRRHWKYETC